SDLKHFVETTIPETRRMEQWHEPAHDPTGKYAVDYRINRRERPIYLFALPTTDRVNVATISLIKLKQWGQAGVPVAVFEDQTRIHAKAFARLADENPRMYTDLATAKELFPQEFPDVVV